MAPSRTANKEIFSETGKLTGQLITESLFGPSTLSFLTESWSPHDRKSPQHCGSAPLCNLGY
jgi:hypothetical protein